MPRWCAVASETGSFGIGLECPARAIGTAATNNYGPGDNLVLLGSGCVLSQNLAP